MKYGLSFLTSPPQVLTGKIVLGILLKGNGPAQIAPEIWPIALFAAVALTLGVIRYRQTLD